VSNSSRLKFSVHLSIKQSNLCRKKVHNGGHNVVWIGVGYVTGYRVIVLSRLTLMAYL
jgi:hypothetical protein